MPVAKEGRGPPYYGGSKAVTGRTADDKTPSNLMTYLLDAFFIPSFKKKKTNGD